MAGPTKYRDIEIRGVVYADTKAVAEKFGVSARSVATALKQGRAQTIGLGRGHKATMPVEVRGTVYPSAQSAASALNVSDKAVYQAIGRGTTHLLGLNANRSIPHSAHKARSRPITLGGMSFPSQRAASRALGFHKEYIGRVLRGDVSNPKQARQRILAAAMRLNAEQDRKAAA